MTDNKTPFDTSELLINTKDKLLVHKETGISAHYAKSENETENLEAFERALKSLKLYYGMYLINNM